ncbi:hypothetical protein V1478_016041 [Vespula squamosa]|uniref:Uncharacterized protein n=1 Tax=Vespula squamosa TaxID=30214 RepID=A0ABD2A2I7_VESSQ
MVGSNIRRTTSKYDTREAEKPIVRCVQPGYGNPMQMTELSEVSDEGSAHFIGTFRGQLRAEACGRRGNGTVHAALRYVVLLLWSNPRALNDAAEKDEAKKKKEVRVGNPEASIAYQCPREFIVRSWNEEGPPAKVRRERKPAHGPNETLERKINENEDENEEGGINELHRIVESKGHEAFR